ncbi:MAG: maleylacetoacetate isomerase [Defluviicoccus sp.]|nr:maleylacetoacetate isomerase [Defluviicoccus sp.]MDE0384637.1 maleylacetoacetate isomerase [Defluviicoccus sp.]
MKLFSYWRSLASYRVRIALNLKGVDCDIETIDLLGGDQFEASYRAVNPQPVVPALVDGGTVLFQSLAIVEYLDETRPEPPLLPADPRGRARVRGIAQIASSDTHPLIVPRIRKYLTEDLALSDDELQAWIRRWMGAGLAAMEAHLAAGPGTGRFCHGDRPGLADLCLVPQIVGSRMFGCPMDPYPTAMRIFEACMAVDPIADAHPTKQPDFPADA